jgi:hypothetical protein
MYMYIHVHVYMYMLYGFTLKLTFVINVHSLAVSTRYMDGTMEPTT